MYNLMHYRKFKANFRFNPFIRLFILNEIFFWSIWYTILPILASFIVASIPGGKIEDGVYGFTAYVVSRVIGGLLSGLFFPKPSDRTQLSIIVSGILLLSIAYAGFAISTSILMFLGSYILAGFALGISNPVRCSLFSEHIDKNQEVTEWSMDENMVYVGTALAALVSGLILSKYSFQLLFILAAIVNLLSIIPFTIIMKHIRLIKNSEIK